MKIFSRISPQCVIMLIGFFTACTNNHPRIIGIDPKFGSEGEIITISGENFGEAGNGAYITIAGERPTASSYALWQANTIQVRITRSGMSGLVYVFVNGKQSNGVVLSDRDAIPQKPPSAEFVKTGPMINAVNPKRVSPGDILTITGSGFGASRENLGVFFTWDIAGSSAQLDLPVSSFEGGYESWGEREIRVHVPDGAGSGLLTVKTRDDNGETAETPMSAVPGSQAHLEVSQARGKKALREGREYIVVLSTDVMVQEASSPNALYLAIPRPIAGASQQIVRILSKTSEPFTEDYRGTTLYKMSNLRPGEITRVSMSYLVAVYTVETAVTQSALTQDTSLPAYKAYLGKTQLVPADNREITAKAASITGRERNPYLKAQLIYRALLKELSISGTGTPGMRNVKPEASASAGSEAAIQALQSKNADSYSASLLFTALCRAAGIPAVPCSGVLVNTDLSTVKHYWAAFWLDGVGWLPVDIALGAGVTPDKWTLHPNYAAWYFGNMDNQRIAFSSGETILPTIAPKGRTVSHDRSYALQNIWEEATGGLESYSSFWSDININGIYYR